MLKASADDGRTTDEAPPAAEAAKPAKAITDPAPEPDASAAAADDKTPTGVQKRIDKAVKAQRAAERRAEELETRLAEATESRPAPAKAADPAPPVKAAEGRPQAKDFNTYEEYVEALTDFKIGLAATARAKVESDRKIADANAVKGTEWNARVEAAKKLPALADFDDVLAEAASVPISEAMHVSIFESERGPEIAYHLAKQPDEAARIAKLGPLAAAREIGKIEAKLSSAEPAKPAAKPLPKPPAQAGGGHSPSDIDLNDENLSQAGWAREFKKRLKATNDN